ncbi:hypothetical protein [Pontixanthobacter sp. CEM42]|uniref:hypothetical protein n=1 Tax=Pontixanthobacter sp. CEM42 TaxID=2792077 RepID=UPI001AE0014B|nr:hypothetical protein [Pontixanthobacter sp. CEM42]
MSDVDTSIRGSKPDGEPEVANDKESVTAEPLPQRVQQRTIFVSILIVLFCTFALYIYAGAWLQSIWSDGDAAEMPILDRLISMSQVGASGRLVVPITFLFLAIISFFIESEMPRYLWWFTGGAVIVLLIATLGLYFYVGGRSFVQNIFPSFDTVSGALAEIDLNSNLSGEEADKAMRETVSSMLSNLTGGVVFGFLWSTSIAVSIIKNKTVAPKDMI